MTGFLGKDDLRTLTGAARQGDQVAWLRAEGIPYKMNRRDELVVAWRHVHAWIEGRDAPLSSVRPTLSRVT